jgi:hypothetical protein
VNEYIELLRLADKKIKKLEKENKGISLALSLPSSNESSKQQSRIAELEKERDVLTAFIIKRMPPIGAMSSTYEICKIISDEVDLILEAHNLEQQAKGCFESIQEIDTHWVNGDSCISVRAINNLGVKKQLQAKALKE